MANGTLYGNSSMGFGYSPDRSRDVDITNRKSDFLYAITYQKRIKGGAI